jgi:hypothetical protein
MKYLDLSPYIRAEAQGVPDFILERSVRDSAIDFCIATDVFRPEPEDVIITAGITEYALTIPVGTELNHIIDVYRDREKLTPVSYSRLLEITGDGSEKSTPKVYSQRDNKEFFLAPVPAVSEKLKILYSLKPSSTSSSIPDTVGKEYREALIHGALYRLQMMPDQIWSNMNQAQGNKMLFEKRSTEIMRQVRYGYAGAALTVRGRAFI